MTEFEITMNGVPVGTALVEKQGLYYRFFCQCVFKDKNIHTIWALWGENCRKLGVCVPSGRYFCLDTKVPIKHIPDTGLRFEVDFRETQLEPFCPVDPEKPFAYIDKLTEARFAAPEGQPGLIIPN